MTSKHEVPDLEVRDLEKLFGTDAGLRAVSFKVVRGTTLGVTGTGGTGKTMLVSILAGFVKPSSGQALVLGRRPGAARLRGMVGTFSQRAKLPQLETVSEFLEHLTRLQGLDPSVHLTEILERLELTSVLNTRCEQVSSGDAKRVAIAAALIGKPRIVLLDEPTLGLSPHDTGLVRAALHELAPRSTVILASGDSSDLMNCDEVVTLSKSAIQGNRAAHQRKGSRDALSAAISSATRSEPSRLSVEGTPS